MTKEEAIKIFQVMKKIMSIPNSDAARTIEAIDMAIEALSAEAEPKWNCTANFVAEQLDRLRDMTEEERWDFFIRFFSPSAEAVPQSEQYKKGFEDAKRAFELEFAREAESIRKRNAQLEVMFNVQKAILADAYFTDGNKIAEWIPCSERLPREDG